DLSGNYEVYYKKLKEVYVRELRKVEEKLNDCIEVEFYDENDMRLKNWIVTCEIVTERIFNEEKIELDEDMIEESDNTDEERSELMEIDDKNDKVREKEEDNSSEKNGTDDSEENEEIVRSENYQVLMIRLKHKKEDIDEEMLEKENGGLSLLQLCHKMRRNNQMLLEIHYYLGKRFEERLEQEINKRKGKNRKRRTDKEEREKIYKEMLETDVVRTRKGLKRMMEKAEKVCLLVNKIGKKRVFERPENVKDENELDDETEIEK
ncbi:977_t:CDS:2, partial [Rhizophagus irregularis]